MIAQLRRRRDVLLPAGVAGLALAIIGLVLAVVRIEPPVAAAIVAGSATVLSGISGLAGNGTQSFTYDSLRRVKGSSITSGPTHTYGYDANSNRTSWNDGTATTNYDYNETNELTAQHRSGVDRNYTYNGYGNMTSSAVASSGATTYSYDAQDRVTSITPPSGGATSFTLDALGRHWTKSVGGTLTDTYGYIGASEAIVRIDQASGSVSAAIDALGNRAATSTSGGGFGWLLPDLHGDVAGAFTSSGSAISDAFRYSAYGTTLAKTTSGPPSPWRFQGRLALNTDDGTGVNTDLYDFVARAYDPNLAAFTSLDTVAGGAQNPLTLNRFLYALASPATLIDPDGHYVDWGNDADSIQSAIAQNKNRAAIARYNAQSTVRRHVQDEIDERISDPKLARWLAIARDPAAAANRGVQGVADSFVQFGIDSVVGTYCITVHIGCAPQVVPANWDPIGSVKAGVGDWWNRYTSGDPYQMGRAVGDGTVTVLSVASLGRAGAGALGRIAGAGPGVAGVEAQGAVALQTDLVPAFARSQYGRLTAAERAAAIERGSTCLYCGTAPSTTVDHVTSLKQDWLSGGWLDDFVTRTNRANSLENLAGACLPCNAAKQARDIGAGLGQWWPSGWPRFVWWPFGTP